MPSKDPSLQTSEEVAQFFQTDLKRGLSAEEAWRRLGLAGENLLPKPATFPVWALFLRQFANPLVSLLFVAAALALFLGEWVEMQTIAAIVLLNACVGFVQEHRAQKAFESLQRLEIPRSRVIRSEEVEEIPSKEIVPGDLVLLEAGDLVPVDGRLIYVAQFAAHEATITGESVPVYKMTSPLGEAALTIADRTNCVFFGTEVVRGKAICLAIATGKQTELGKIASALEGEKKEKTPLELKLERLCRHLFYFAGVILAVLFPLGILRGESWLSMLLITLSLALAAIPAGLVAIVTISLAVGVQRMASRKALIRRLASVETLGCTSVICADKTGTLTLNEMVVRKIWAGGRIYGVSGSGYAPHGKFFVNETRVDPIREPALLQALQIAVLCNEAELIQDKVSWKIRGDPTEGALLVAAAKAGLHQETLEEEHPFLGELPFDSTRRRMSVLRKGPRLFVKGAPDEILRLSEGVEKESLARQVEEFAAEGLRVLAVAYRDLSHEDLSFEVENQLTFVGLFGMIDPPRPGVREAISECLNAEIRPILMTGDHQQTALAVAKEVGIMQPGTEVLEGYMIEKLDDLALRKQVMRTSVYARVSAEHKLRIVKALKEEGQIVAMTGDGVNDAPAISQADIGIAMGISGTDVTKEASDMILLDDHFATIVGAIEQGRTIYKNILKFVMFLLSANFAELFSLFFGILIGFESHGENYWVILLPAQILWINLVTDGFPAVALAFDPSDRKTMQQPPRKLEEPILSFRRSVQVILIGIVISVATLAAAYFGFDQGRVHGQTMAFTALVIIELGVVLLIHFPLTLRSNPKLVGAVLISLAAQLLVLYVPFFQEAFQTEALSGRDWGLLVLICFFCNAVNWWILRRL